MKKLLILALALMPTLLFAKEYSEVVEVPGKNADQLYSSAREWFAETFNSANNVLQMDDPVAGKLIGKGSTTVVETLGSGLAVIHPIYNIDFTIKVFVKDGKYKASIEDIKANYIKSNPSDFDLSITYSDLCKNREYYENGSNVDWLKNNHPEIKSHYKAVANANKMSSNLLNDIEVKMDGVIKSLKLSMNKSEDDW